MRYARVLLFVVLLSLATSLPAAAADVRSGNDVTVGAGETIEDDVYAFGNTINILGTIKGDLVAFGQNISIDGVVTGSVTAAGNSVAIRGEVGGSVRAAGNSVVVDGKVGGDVVVATQELTVLRNGRVGRDALVVGRVVTLAGQIGRDLQAGAQTITVDGRVGRDVLAQVETLRLTKSAVVDGAVTYESAKDAVVESGAAVRGKTERRAPQRMAEPAQGPLALAIDWLRGLVGLLLLGLLIVIFFPGFSRRAGEALVRSPWVSLAVGVVVLIGLPILAVLVFILGALIGGWWLGLVALAAYFVLLAVSVPVSAVGVGGALLRVAGRPVPVWLALIVGLVVLLLVGLVPILGAIVILCALLFGLGASTMAIFRGRRPEPAPA